LNGNVKVDLPTRSTVPYEFPERAVITGLLSQPLNELEGEQAMKLRIKFIHNLVKYSHRVESPPGGTPSKVINIQSMSEGDRSVMGVKRSASNANSAY
ncbi:hypothetical protein K469DRAFT_590896, partial [Zopfia rhizophila CBS 207.26]